MITQKELKETLHYDPETGFFTWIVRRQKIKKGSIAGCINKVDGYRVIQIRGKSYKAHRLAFLYMTGEFANHDMDHINHNRSDNRWVNLREATRSENLRNASKSKTNTSGVTGVYWHKPMSKWLAQIMINGSNKHLGYFAYKEDAIIAREKANIKYGYHANHGQ